jgi:UDP-glucose 4-epimerase
MNLAYPGPVVVLGHTGFIGRPLTTLLRDAGAAVHGFSSAELNLRDPAAFCILDDLTGPDTTLFVCAALTPDRGASIATCVDHIGMTANLAQYLSDRELRKCVQVSSDAVYPLIDEPVTEDTPVAPSGAYPLAKYTSERLMEMALSPRGIPLLIVRPTGVFGPGDTHNSYGPNRFIRTLVNDRSVRLFGQGEELRDHMFLDDLTKILAELGASDVTGTLNIATGESRSFGSIVESLRAVAPTEFEVVNAPRSGAVTHREFDIRRLRAALPDLQFTPFEVALASTLAAVQTGTPA